jgi:hypothetical protein
MAKLVHLGTVVLTDSGARPFTFHSLMERAHSGKVFRSLERGLLYSPMQEKPGIWRDPIPENSFLLSSGLWLEICYIPSCWGLPVPGVRQAL